MNYKGRHFSKREQGGIGLYGAIAEQALEDYRKLKDKKRSGYEEGVYSSAVSFLFNPDHPGGLMHIIEMFGVEKDYLINLIEGKNYGLHLCEMYDAIPEYEKSNDLS